jgi:hypothetical protein
MTLPAYARTTEGKARQLGSGPIPCRLGLELGKVLEMIQKAIIKTDDKIFWR